MFKRTALSVLFVSSVFAAGCGGSDASADSAKEKLQNPTGSFNKDNSQAALTTYNDDKKQNGNGPSLFGASVSDGGLRSLSARLDRAPGYRWKPMATAIRLMDAGGDAGIQCDASSASGGGDSGSISCTCSKGGSVDIDFERDGEDISMTASYDNCDMGTSKINADMSMLMTKSEIVQIKKAPAGGGISTGGYNILFNLVGTVTVDSKDNTIDGAVLIQSGYYFVSVKVNDGYITFGTNGSSFQVGTKAGVVTCENGKCTDENGKDFDFKAVAGN